MRQRLPSVIVTGASGFIGRHVVSALLDDHRVYALARRPRREVDLPAHPHLRWILVDVADAARVGRALAPLQAEPEHRLLVHLAGHYDFTGRDHPEYRRTNVEGTRIMLRWAHRLGVGRFLLASSVAACRFPAPGERVGPDTPADADHPYAASKREAEALTDAAPLPTVIVRLAAVFSDWCEYAPLYTLLEMWRRPGRRGRLLAGDGRFAIPYLHVEDVVDLVRQVLARGGDLPRHARYVAAPPAATSHREIFLRVRELVSLRPERPLSVPPALARAALVVAERAGELVGRPPFLRPWMLDYLGRRLETDPSRTRRELGWTATPRRFLLRRLPLLLEMARSDPWQWHRRNTAAMKRERPRRPALVVADAMLAMKDEIVAELLAAVQGEEGRRRLPRYNALDPEKLRLYLEITYDLLLGSVRTGDRLALVNYCRFLANIRSREGFTAREMTTALRLVGETIRRRLLARPEVAPLAATVQQGLMTAVALAVDEVEETFALIERRRGGS